MCCLWLLGAGAGLAQEPGLFAAQLDAQNLGNHRVGGVDAVAGVGDWALGNGRVCAAIAGLEHESMLSDRGGVLVDLGHCGRGDDQWGVLQPVLNLSRDEIIPTLSIRSEVVGGEARVVTTGRLHGTRVETVYAIARAPSTALMLRTTLEREVPGESAFLIADIAIHGNGQLTPFTLASRDEGTSLGFEHPAVNVDDFFSAADAMVRADIQILLGARGLEPQIAYGWRILGARIDRSDGSSEPLAHLAMNGKHFSILGAYTETLLWGGVGPPNIAELLQMLWMDLGVGDRVVYEREILLGERATAASITDQLWSRGTLIEGRLDAAGATLHVQSPAGVPLTHLETDADGRFRFRLPPGAQGQHLLEVRPNFGDLVEIPFQVSAGTPSLELPLGTTPQPGRLKLPRGEIMRLTLIGLGETPTPRLRADRRGFSVGGREIPGHAESNAVSLAGVAGDVRSLELAPGRYRVIASRGPLWSLSVKEIEVRGGQEIPLEIEPPVRILEHPGWLSADFHVHAAPSDDSGLPLRQRLSEFVAMGADLIVSTEHDNVYDYQPMIEEMGLAEEIHSLVGVEITSTYRGSETPQTAGHSNAFPLAVQPEAYRGGAPQSQNRRLGRIVEEVHARPGRPLVQINHPREGGVDSGLGSFFSHLSVSESGHDPTRPLSAAGNRSLIERPRPGAPRDIDFDAIELLNGASMEHYRMARADWFAFLLQGEIRTGTANSDSHRASETIAIPVNYVVYSPPTPEAEDAPIELDVPALVAAIRGGRSYGSSGPLLDVRLGESGPGEMFQGERGTLSIGVRAAPWVPIGEVRVFVSGALALRKSLGQSGELSVPLRFDRDAFVTVEVEGKAEPGSLYAQVAPGYTPFAFTNPVFVDADGDGKWLPPGLAPDGLPTLSAPFEAP
ncbi:MAG: CehA/McbA family metallohydrolase [Myxococcota bacterium]|nr:CehA/McbA family metallohydrolase [Myxococcota bacterium]